MNFMKRLSKNIVSIISVMLAVSCIFAGGKKDKTSSKKQSEDSSVNVEIPADKSDLIQDVSEQAESSEPISENTEPASVKNAFRTGAVSGICAMPFVYFFDGTYVADGSPVTLESDSVENICAKLQEGQLEAGFIPADRAVELLKKSDESLKLLAVCSTLNHSVLTSLPELQSFEDFDFEAFKGKKIFITEKDSAADYAFRYILKAHGLEEGEGPDFVEIDYTVSNEHAVQAMLSDSVEIIIIGEPYATAVMMKNQGAQKIFDLSAEYLKVAQESGFSQALPSVCVVVNDDYAKKYPQRIAEFEAAVSECVAKTVKNPQKAGVLYQKHLHSFMAPVIGKSIASSNFVFKPSSQIRQEFEVLTKLMSLFTSEESISVLSDEAFYSPE